MVDGHSRNPLYYTKFKKGHLRTVLNNQILQADMVPYATGERELAAEYLLYSRPDDLFLYDRGYPFLAAAALPIAFPIAFPLTAQMLVQFAPGCLVPLDVPVDPLVADHGVAHGPRRVCDLLGEWPSACAICRCVRPQLPPSSVPCVAVIL